MGRETRRVPKDWEHPKYKDGSFVPLLGFSFSESLQEWKEIAEKWSQGLDIGYTKEGNQEWVPIEDACRGLTYEEYGGKCPCAEDYMPDWPEEERTHYQMYESTSEGTPISPVMETPEELAQWLTDNRANAFAGQTASYEGWLRVCKGRSAPTMVVDTVMRTIVSGVDSD